MNFQHKLLYKFFYLRFKILLCLLEKNVFTKLKNMYLFLFYSILHLGRNYLIIIIYVYLICLKTKFNKCIYFQNITI
jgi:hypothetical protein